MVQARLIASPPTKPPSKTAGLKVSFGLLATLGLTLGFGLRVNPRAFILHGGCGQGHSNERNASTSLKTIALAEFDFRSADRDWNQVNDFWGKDVAGLYAFHAADDLTRTPIRLVELSVAAADDRPICDLTPYALKCPKAGYWFRSIPHEHDQKPSPDKFAYCAFPDTPNAGRWTFIIDEQNVIYRKELKNQRGVEGYPVDPVAAGWQKLD
ncbi:MAG: hypothetical protein JO332_17970 [Planctomycetaceae bacterium]|nr:hypothetical protein [Planctomycetaceae bacterium]